MSIFYIPSSALIKSESPYAIPGVEQSHDNLRLVTIVRTPREFLLKGPTPVSISSILGLPTPRYSYLPIETPDRIIALSTADFKNRFAEAQAHERHLSSA
jgi:hypothetical protein